MAIVEVLDHKLCEVVIPNNQYSGIPDRQKKKKELKNKDGSSTSTSSTISASHLENVVERLWIERNRSSTRRIYHCVWRQFNEFFIRLDVKPDTWEERLVLFVGFLVEDSKKSTTIKSYISAIKAVFREDGVEISEDRYLLSSLTKACKYKNDHVCIRLPISKSILNLILERTFTHYSEIGQPYLMKLYAAMFAAGCYGLLRVGEITTGEHPIKAADVQIADERRKIKFVLRTSKTHWKDVKPQIVKISSTSYLESSRYCPFKILNDYVKARPKCTDKTEAFFVFSDKTPVTPNQMRATLKLMLELEGLNHENYNVHSLRIGHCIDLHYKLKISIESVKRIGRWHSNSVFSYLA